MTQEEFEKTVRARWPDAEFLPEEMTAIVGTRTAKATVALTDGALRDWVVISGTLHGTGATLEHAVHHLEMRVLRQLYYSGLGAAQAVIGAVSPGSTIDAAIRRPGDAQKEGRE